MTKVAVVQAGSILFDTPRTIEKFSDLAHDAAAQGAELIVFPEAFIGGYPKGLDFGAKLGTRSAAGREEFRRYYDSAIDVAGTGGTTLGKVARDNGVHIVVGAVERVGGTLYCSALTYGPNGALLANHRKLMPTALELLVWGFGDGSTLKVVATAVGRIGSVICWENYMPLLRAAMYAQNVELYCAPTVDDRDSWLAAMRTIAIEGRCFVLSAVQYFTKTDAIAVQDNPLWAQAPDVLIKGGSCIIDPLGTVVVEPDFHGETIKFAEIDRRSIARGKFDLDVCGHYARPDIFRLDVDTRAKAPVCFPFDETSQESKP